MNLIKSAAIAFALSGLPTTPSQATPRIAVLNFELNDITSLPNTPSELQRTESMAPLLEQAISRTGGYEIVYIDATAQKSANAGFGYLFHFHDLAAQLGKQFGADWVIVGQHSKPSFLFSYLWAYLIDVNAQNNVARYDIELKGNHQKVTYRSINALAGKIVRTITEHKPR